MKNIKNSIAFAVLLIIGLLSCSSEDAKPPVHTPATQQTENTTENVLPAFKMTDVNGNTVDLASFKGKKVFVNLWATWCPPCREEIPSIEALSAKVDKENTIFIMLSLDENFDLAKNYAMNQKMQVPIYYPAEKLPVMFDTEGIPATFIFNEAGILIKQNLGSDNYDTEEYLQLLNSK